VKRDNFYFLAMIRLISLVLVEITCLKAFHTKNSFVPSSTLIFRIRRSSASSSSEIDVDVAVVGGGIAGTTISWLLQQNEDCKVALIDPNAQNINSTWYPNYGEWRDEWHSLSEALNLVELKECTTTEWEVTDCFFGGNFQIPMNERTRLDRPYIRVDRIKLQGLLRRKFAEAGGLAIASKISAKKLSPNLFDTTALVHHSEGSVITLDNQNRVNAKVVIDATGFESRLVAREDPYNARGNPRVLRPGYQIAYGFIAYIDNMGPYDPLAMTLFDYRTDYNADTTNKDIIDRPTFMYVMPLKILEGGKYKVFFEETSLVGRDSRMLSFTECKKRALERLAFYNITIESIEEEEYCYIPMGGELPDLTQRIVAFGGSANMVHPSTGIGSIFSYDLNLHLSIFSHSVYVVIPFSGEHIIVFEVISTGYVVPVDFLKFSQHYG